MVNPRQKGNLGERKVIEVLKKSFDLDFQQTPGSGSGNIKGDIHIPKYKNNYCIEVKNYADSPFSDKMFTNKTNKLVEWWTKLKKDCRGVQKPLLIYRYNRSKLFVVTSIKPKNVQRYIDISWLNCYIMLLDEWIEQEDIIWLNLPQ